MIYKCDKCGSEYDLAGLHPGEQYQCQCGKSFAVPVPKSPGKILPVILLVISGLLMSAGLGMAIWIGSMLEQPVKKTDEIFFMFSIGLFLFWVLLFVLGAILAALCDISLQLRRRR